MTTQERIEWYKRCSGYARKAWKNGTVDDKGYIHLKETMVETAIAMGQIK